MAAPILRLGNDGTHVRRLTRLLRGLGYLDRTSSAFDRAVRAAVTEFQSRHVDERGIPLKVDGVVGPLTWWALENQTVRFPIQDTPPMPRHGGTKRGRAALRTALREMDYGAREVGANNDGRWIKKYLNDILDPPANWCAGFVSWCFEQDPAGCPYNYSLGARDIRSQLKANGWTYDLSDDVHPEPGDAVIWWRGRSDGWRGHIGFVYQCTPGGILYTIEGNKGPFPARVRKFDYVLSQMERLLGFGRVPD